LILYVFSKIYQLFSSQNSYYFIGLHDQVNEGEFVWLNGIPLPNNDSLWQVGQPNDDGDCCRIRFPRTTRLILDGFCTTLYHAICERPI